MAVYHLSAKIIGKTNKGKSPGATSLRTVVAAAAYRAGEKLKNLVNGQSYDFTKKQVVHAEILLPQGAPSRWHNRQVLWNEVEAKETGAKAQYCRELVIALPTELSQEDNIQLIRCFAQRNFVDLGMCADIAYHDPKPRGGGVRNPHAHVMLTMREVSHGRFGNKSRDWNSRELLEQWRAAWEEECNELLARRGVDARIDHRSLKDQGIDREPTVHLGVEANAMERKGIPTAKGNINRRIRAYNTCLSAGVEAPNLLAGLNQLWQAAADQRSKGPKGQQRSTSGKNPQGRGTADPEIQRRTYTSAPPTCAAGVPPAPGLDGENAPRGEKTEQKAPPRQGQKAGPSGRASQPHEEKDAGATGEASRPRKEKTGGRRSIRDRLDEAREKLARGGAPHTDRTNQTPGNWGAAKYDIKVMTSMEETLLRQGIDSYAQLETRLAAERQSAEDLRGELREISRLLGVLRAGRDAGQKAEQLRGEIQHKEKLLGAAIRVQANQQYADGYQKTMFKSNYMKKYGDKLETYYRAVRQLHELGHSEATTPQHLTPGLNLLREDLKRVNGKYQWAIRELAKVGLDISTLEGMQRVTKELSGRKENLTQRLRDQGREVYKWQSIKAQLDNIHEGNRPREPAPRKKSREEPSR